MGLALHHPVPVLWEQELPSLVLVRSCCSMTCSDPVQDQAGILLKYKQRLLGPSPRESRAWCSVSQPHVDPMEPAAHSVLKAGGGGGGGCCLSLAEAEGGSLPCAVLNTLSCSAGRT